MSLFFYTCTVWNKAYRGAKITRYGPVFFVPCSKTRDVSTEFQELYSFWFGLNPWHGKSDVRILHWNAACGDPEISLYFQICRTSARSVKLGLSFHVFLKIVFSTVSLGIIFPNTRRVDLYSRTRFSTVLRESRSIQEPEIPRYQKNRSVF